MYDEVEISWCVPLYSQVDNIGYEYETLEPVEETEFNDRHVMVVGGVETNMTSYGLDGLHGYTGCLTGTFSHATRPLFDYLALSFLGYRNSNFVRTCIRRILSDFQRCALSDIDQIHPENHYLKSCISFVSLFLSFLQGNLTCYNFS